MALHIRSLLHEIQYGRIEYWDDEVHESSKPVWLFVDNKWTIAAAIADETTRSLKHVDVRLWWLRDLISAGDVELAYISSDDNYADLYTKALKPAKLTQMLTAMQVVDYQEHMGVDAAPSELQNWGSVTGQFGINEIADML